MRPGGLLRGLPREVLMKRLFPLLVVTSGCFAVADLERFDAVEDEPAGVFDDPADPSSLELTLVGMGPHGDQLIEFRVVDDQNFIQCRGVIDPIDHPPVDRVTLNLRNAIPAQNGPYRLDLYADVNGSGSYDGVPGPVTADHAWRIAPLADFPADEFVHRANVVQVRYQHNTQFTDIDQWPDGVAAPARSPSADARLRFAEGHMGEYVGKLLEVRLVQAHAPFHTVGLYRSGSVPAGDFEAVVKGVVETGDRYRIDVYVDANGNGLYDNPAEAGADRGWRFERTAELAGEEALAIDFAFEPDDPAVPATTDVGAP
jgi:hypothetical protein